MKKPFSFVIELYNWIDKFKAFYLKGSKYIYNYGSIFTYLG